MKTKEELLDELLDIYADGGDWEDLEPIFVEIIDERDDLLDQLNKALQGKWQV